jgi:hypothetical protein
VCPALLAYGSRAQVDDLHNDGVAELFAPTLNHVVVAGRKRDPDGVRRLPWTNHLRARRQRRALRMAPLDILQPTHDLVFHNAPDTIHDADPKPWT